MRHRWPVRLYNLFPHYLTNSTILRGGVTEHEIVFWFSQQLFPETFLILRRTEQDMILKNVYCSLCKYPLFSSDFNETWIFSTDFLKIQKYKFSWTYVQWEPNCSMRTDMTKPIVAFLNSANMPNKRQHSELSKSCIWIPTLVPTIQ